MLKLDGKTLAYDRAFTHNNINYPKNWLRLTSLSEKQAIGITEVADPVTPSYNQKFYWGVDNPKDIDQLKVDWIAKQKKEAAGLLAPTDWLVTRYAEATTAIPESTKTYRAALRTVCGERETQITACADTDALCALLTGGLPKTIEGTADNGATEKLDTSKEKFDTSKEVLVDGASQEPKVYESFDPKQYESYDPKQYEAVANPALLKEWPDAP